MVTRVLVPLLLAGAVSAHAAGAPPAKGAEAPRIHWVRSLSAALKQARAENKPVMIDFWAEWCGWCHELDRSTYRDRAVVDLAEKLVSVKVDTEGSQTEARIAADYRVDSLPTIAFVSPEGRMILRVSGFQRAADFVDTVEQALKTGKDVMAWEAALGVDPKDALALNKLGAHLFDAEFYEASRDLLQRAIAVDQERPVKERKRTRTLLGIIMHFDNKPAEAEKVLKESLDIKPADPEEDAASLYTLGKSYLKSGRTPEARTTLQKVLDAYPQSKPAARARETLDAMPPAR
jgi:thioredoxin-like negative regulator of GroEL